MFNEAERRIFGPYFNGAALVYADPIRVHRRLHHALDGEVNKYLRQAKSENANEAFQAKEKLLAAAVYAFEMIPFDPDTGKGALEQDMKAALRLFLEFMHEKKEQGPISPTCSPVTPPPQDRPNHSTTLPGLPSGVTFPASAPSRPGR